MLTIKIPKGEYWDEASNEFRSNNDITLVLEHSLVSISRWESRYHKTFLSNLKKEPEEMEYYIRCMTIRCTDDSAYSLLTERDNKRIVEYIQDPMTACYFNNKQQGRNNSREPMTSELLYYLMFSNGIPIECEKWHLNRLLALLQVFQIKNASNNPKKPLSRSQLMDRSKLNAARKAKMGSHG